MNRIEKILRDKKNDIDNIKVPDELEGRLHKALENKKIVNKKKGIRVRIVAACLIILLVGYNFDTLAFYGKRIIGFNNIMNGTLKELNEIGKGQIIDKSYTFENGGSITLDGIMLDESQILVFYTIKDSRGRVDEMVPIFKLEGLLGEYDHQSGRGQVNDEKTIMKNIDSFEAPYFFERSLDLKFWIRENDLKEEGKISFKVDRNKAMGHTLKVNINKSIQLDKANMEFDSILATPTRTVIKGSIQNILELAKDEIMNTRIRPNQFELKLIANGKEIPPQSGGITTDYFGITFHDEYDPLPKNLKSLKLKLVSFSSDHDVNKVIDINKKSLDQQLDVMGQKIVVNKVYESKGKTFINITTEENTVITKLYLLADDKRIELNRTIENEYDKLENGDILHTRTLEFNGTGKEYKLDIKRMTYSKDYNKIIDIPIQ